MKCRQTLPFKWLGKKGQRGQAIVEYVLLMAVMSLITYGFVYFMNRNLAKYWEYSANLVLNDKPGVTTVRLD